MARIFIDGFESGEHDMWDAENNATVISSSGLDMDGDYCLDINENTEYLEKDFTLDDEMYFAFLWRCISLGGNRCLISIRNGSTILAAVDYDAATTHLRYAGIGINDGSIVISVDTTYLIEFRFKLADSGGKAVVKIDGVTDIDFTGDTKPDANTQFNRICLGYRGAGIGTYAYFDNFIMDDAAWIGDTKIQKILPTGAGNSANWTPSAGANWQCVDERPPSDADYVSINSNDIVDTYAAANMAGSIDSVKCVQVQSRTESDGSPTPTNLKLVARSGGTDYLSGDKSVPAAPAGLYNLWETNPADSQAWEEADVNALEIGIKSAA